MHAPTAVTDFTDAQQTLPGGVYPSEVEEIACRLLPSRQIARIDHMSLHGGASPQVFPAGGAATMAHQDTGFTPRDFCDNMMAYNQDVPAHTEWAEEYMQYMQPGAANGVEGQLQLNIWRPRKMNDHPAPLSSMPLALLDGTTIDTADLVRVALLGRGKLGDPSMELHVRENPAQRWVYYPCVRAQLFPLHFPFPFRL